MAVNRPVDEIVQLGDANRTGVDGDCRKLHGPASVMLKPPPVTDTPVPCGPEAGERAMCGPVTTKLADPISPLLPFTETV